VAALQTGVAALQTGVAALQTGVAALQTGVAALQTGVAALQTWPCFQRYGRHACFLTRVLYCFSLAGSKRTLQRVHDHRFQRSSIFFHTVPTVGIPEG